MAESTLGVAVLGTGFGQKIHIPGLQIHHRTQLVTVYHRDLTKAQAIAAQHQIPHACDSLEQILALPTVNAVSIATPPFLHRDMAIAALNPRTVPVCVLRAMRDSFWVCDGCHVL